MIDLSMTSSIWSRLRKTSTHDPYHDFEMKRARNTKQCECFFDLWSFVYICRNVSFPLYQAYVSWNIADLYRKHWWLFTINQRVFLKLSTDFELNRVRVCNTLVFICEFCANFTRYLNTSNFMFLSKYTRGRARWLVDWINVIPALVFTAQQL